MKYLPSQIHEQIKENVLLRNEQIVAHYNPFHNDEYQLGVILLLCFNNQTHIDNDIQRQLDDLVHQTTTQDSLLLNIIYKLLTQNNIPLEEDLFNNVDEVSNL